MATNDPPRDPLEGVDDATLAALPREVGDLLRHFRSALREERTRRVDLEQRITALQASARDPTAGSVTSGGLASGGMGPDSTNSGRSVIRQSLPPVRRRFDGAPGSHPSVFRSWRAAVETTLALDPDPSFGVNFIYTCLDGQALQWWSLTGMKELQDAGIDLTPCTFLDALQARFLVSDSPAQVRADLDALQLDRKEKILDFYHRVLEFRKRDSTLSMDELRRRFESGLPAPYRELLDSLAQNNRLLQPEFSWSLRSSADYLHGLELRNALPPLKQATVHVLSTGTEPGSQQDSRRGLSKTEFDRRRRLGLCFKCGAKRQDNRCPRCPVKTGATSSGTTNASGSGNVPATPSAPSPNGKEAPSTTQH